MKILAKIAGVAPAPEMDEPYVECAAGECTLLMTAVVLGMIDAWGVVLKLVGVL
jgi:hypothetical protein